MSPLDIQVADSTAVNGGIPTAYDTVWTNVPTADPVGLESIMLAEDKLFVVLFVVLVIWAGVVLMLIRTDLRIKKLERTMADRSTEDPEQNE